MNNFNDFLISRETGDFRTAFRIINSLIIRSVEQSDYLKASKLYNSKRILVKKFANTFKNKNIKKYLLNEQLRICGEIYNLYFYAKDPLLLNDYYTCRFSSELDVASHSNLRERLKCLSISLESFNRIDKASINSGDRSAIFSSVSRLYYNLGFRRKAFEAIEFAQDLLNETARSDPSDEILKPQRESSIYLNFARLNLFEGNLTEAKKYYTKLENIKDPFNTISYRKTLLLQNLRRAIIHR